MTIRQFLVQSGYARPGATKACCPFHDDAAPSAHIHDDTNTVYCYACRKLYGPKDFRRRFGVTIDEIDTLAAKPVPEYPWGVPLFYA